MRSDRSVERGRRRGPQRRSVRPQARSERPARASRRGGARCAAHGPRVARAREDVDCAVERQPERRRLRVRRQASAVGAAARSWSSTSDKRSTPATPSTMQWWTLLMIAQRPPARPSTIHDSHSGRSRSSSWDISRPMSRRSAHCRPGRQGGVPHVVVEVEIRVVNPDRAAEVQGDETDPLAIAGHEGKLRATARPLLVGGCRPFEHRTRSDVHVRRTVFEVEELCVERAHAIHGSPLGVARRCLTGCIGGGRRTRRAGSAHRVCRSWSPRPDAARPGEPTLTVWVRRSVVPKVLPVMPKDSRAAPCAASFGG